ncbi:hypothetical protein SDC9_165138 [bioreactor metagenome]|uniref:Uncharacterized protein n=1 Tax=bioreactor metagenome TaxID=1076179 RepID=A0A645G0S7_9ZZZZ
MALGGAVPDDLMEKAVDFARRRIGEGKSPFFNGDELDEVARNIYIPEKNTDRPSYQISRETPSDALRRIGGSSGSFNSSNSALNYAKRSADSLDSIKTDIADLNRKVTPSDGEMRAP